MTEEVAVTEGTEQPETAETPDAGRRGRPRPGEVIERDQRVLEAMIAAGAEMTTAEMTRKAIAELTELKESHVYLSLIRLRNAGQVTLRRTGGKHLWSVATAESETVDETPAAE